MLQKDYTAKLKDISLDFLRINGDSPLLDIKIINKSIKLFKRIKKGKL